MIQHQFLRSIVTCSLSFIAAICFLSCPLQAQVAPPDTSAGKRLAQLVEAINEADEDKRLEQIIEIFSKEDDPNELKEVSTIVRDQTGGIKIKEIVNSEELKVTAICTSVSGPMIKISLEVDPKEENRISNIGLQPHEVTKKAKSTGEFIAAFEEDGTTSPMVRGVWMAKGYGYVCEITEDDAKFYDYTGKLGWKIVDEEEDHSDLLFKPGQDKDTARITFHPKEYGFNVVRLEKLPESCREEREWTPTELFDLVNELMEKHYPFFEVRNFDWQGRVNKLRPTVSDEMNETELFTVFEKLFDGLRDAHTRLVGEIDGETKLARSGRSVTMARLLKAYEAAPEPKSKQEFNRAFRKSLDKNIMDDVLRGEGNKACANQILWGFADKEKQVGYFKVKGMGGFGIGDMDFQLATLHETMNEILTTFADTKALIVDISMNGGGSDIYSLEIASHFADKERVGFSKWPAAEEAYRQDRKVIPYIKTNPKGTQYLKPVFLVTNDFSVSAAEIFTMSMRAFPHVTTVGETTSGALSDVLSKTLPNGWELMTSNEIYVDHEGVCFEGLGIPPDVELAIFDPSDILKPVHHETIGKVVKLALEKAEQK